MSDPIDDVVTAAPASAPASAPAIAYSEIFVAIGNSQPFSVAAIVRAFPSHDLAACQAAIDHHVSAGYIAIDSLVDTDDGDALELYRCLVSPIQRPASTPQTFVQALGVKPSAPAPKRPVVQADSYAARWLIENVLDTHGEPPIVMFGKCHTWDGTVWRPIPLYPDLYRYFQDQTLDCFQPDLKHVKAAAESVLIALPHVTPTACPGVSVRTGFVSADTRGNVTRVPHAADQYQTHMLVSTRRAV